MREGGSAKREGGGSSVRYVSGLVLLIAALVTLLSGGFLMVGALERGGYGTPSVDRALALLATGGGFLAIGISLLIWEVSIRHDIQH
jgi:hypothetical protein